MELFDSDLLLRQRERKKKRKEREREKAYVRQNSPRTCHTRPLIYSIIKYNIMKI
jgi:hypothetical protein